MTIEEYLINPSIEMKRIGLELLNGSSHLQLWEKEQIIQRCGYCNQYNVPFNIPVFPYHIEYLDETERLAFIEPLFDKVIHMNTSTCHVTLYGTVVNHHPYVS